MIRYYQTGERSSWSPIPDEKNILSKVTERHGRKMTILAVSEEVNEDTKQADLKYKGPFYADIDVKGSIETAAESALALVEKLESRGVDQKFIQLFASGSKGFHLIVNEKLFSSGRQQKNLPYIYKEMALAMYVTGLDMQVYCGGRGNSWRLENVKREDGNYRVRITFEELVEISEKPQRYKDLTANNRLMPSPPEPSAEDKAPGLEALFISAKATAAKVPAEKATVTSDRLRKEFADDIPECIAQMREGNVKHTANFNQLALNMALFGARSGRDEGEFSSLSLLMSEKTDSSMYNTPTKRQEHIEGVYKYIQTAQRYQFSCAAMRSLLSSNPCEGCSLNRTGEDADATIQSVGISCSDGCYYKVAPSGAATLISTFVITPKHKVTGPSEEDPRVEVLKGVLCQILVNNGQVAERVLNETAWKSKSGFLSAIEGLEGATFFGTDTDIQKLKYFVFNEDDQMDEVKEVNQAGVRIEDFKGFPLPVYVEPGMSLNKFGSQGTHLLSRDISTPPNMKNILVGTEMFIDAGDALELLCGVNKPEVIGLMLGWFAASHLKAHLHHAYRQFPLLNLWGNAGSGKTKTAEMMMWLTGCASDFASLSLSLPHTTKFALIDYVTSTTTIPRILEEYNKARINARDYNNIHEILKSAYNNHPITRGTIGTNSKNGTVNAKTIKMEVTSPLIYITEQPMESPPLRQRSLAIGLEPAGRIEGTRNWKQLQNNRRKLEVVGKLLCLEAIRTTVDEVKTLMDQAELENEHMEERPKYNLQVCKMGLDFLRGVLIKNGFDESVIETLDNLKADVEGQFETIIQDTVQQTARTEVDLVMEDMAMMAYLEESGTAEGLKDGVHFHVRDDYLYLDLPVAHSLYLRYKRTGNVVIETYSQLVKLIRTELYFESDAVMDEELSMNRRFVKLNLNKMQQKGIESGLFG